MTNEELDSVMTNAKGFSKNQYLMNTTYAKSQTTAQKKDAPSASSVLDASSQSESLQRKADMANNAAQRAEAPRPNNTGMPDNLKSGIETLSGFSMDDVRVHYNSSKPATVQALAYTQGTDIHVAPGQEKHLPHEAWHVAQQMAGRVSPTTNINGMPVNDNAGLEHEADVMGEKAVAQKNNSNTFHQNNNCKPRNCLQLLQGEKLQGTQNVHIGNFNYDLKKIPNGAELNYLKFEPNFQIKKNLSEITFVQIVRETGEPDAAEPTKQGNIGFEERTVKDGPFRGWALDSDWIYDTKDDAPILKRIFGTVEKAKEQGKLLEGRKLFINRDFRYSEVRPKDDSEFYNPAHNKPVTEHNGWSMVKKDRIWTSLDVCIRDRPSGLEKMEFQVMILADKKYNLGIINWGYNSEMVNIEFNESGDTGAFEAAAKVWNNIKLDENGKVDPNGRVSLMQMPEEFDQLP